jgi:hypothetical protein
MHTITIDILNAKAERLLEDLESLNLIRLRKERHRTPAIINWNSRSHEKEHLVKKMNDFQKEG